MLDKRNGWYSTKFYIILTLFVLASRDFCSHIRNRVLAVFLYSLFRLKCQFLFPEFTELHKVSHSWITLVIGEEWCFLKCTMFCNEVLHLWHPTPNMSFWIVHTHNYAMVFYIVKSTLSDLTSTSLCSHKIFWASTAGFSHILF